MKPEYEEMEKKLDELNQAVHNFWYNQNYDTEKRAKRAVKNIESTVDAIAFYSDSFFVNEN